jgi:hypothetical protein
MMYNNLIIILLYRWPGRRGHRLYFTQRTSGWCNLWMWNSVRAGKSSLWSFIEYNYICCPYLHPFYGDSHMCWESPRLMKTNKSLWFSFPGRMMRGTEVYTLQRTCGVPPNFIFYEIMHKRNFNVFQQHSTQQSLLLSFFPSPLLCFQVFHKYTPIISPLLRLHNHLFTQFYLFQSIFSQHSMHVVHWFSTSCWVQYIWISFAISCKHFNIISLNSVITYYCRVLECTEWWVLFYVSVEIWSMFCALSRRK